MSGIDTGDYDGFIAAMENRRQYFKDNGAVSSDHSHFDARTDALEVSEAERIYAAARKGDVSESEGPRCVAIWCRRWHGWPVTTAW